MFSSERFNFGQIVDLWGSSVDTEYSGDSLQVARTIICDVILPRPSGARPRT